MGNGNPAVFKSIGHLMMLNIFVFLSSPQTLLSITMAFGSLKDVFLFLSWWSLYSKICMIFFLNSLCWKYPPPSLLKLQTSTILQNYKIRNTYIYLFISVRYLDLDITIAFIYLFQYSQDFSGRELKSMLNIINC